MRRQGQQRQRERLHQPRLGGRVARQLQRVRHQRLHAGPPQARLHALARGRPVGRHHALLLQHHDRQGIPAGTAAGSDHRERSASSGRRGRCTAIQNGMIGGVRHLAGHRKG